MPSQVEGKPQTVDGRAITSFRIERDLLEEFRVVAAANRRSVNQEVRWLMERHVDQWRRAQERKTGA